MDKLKLESTVALVMRWSSQLYSNDYPLRYFKCLDLSSGADLYEQCQSVCAWYQEVILNRKYFIKCLTEQQLKILPAAAQVIILAAGKSPLSIEILSGYSDRVDRVIETDVSGMAAKKQLCLGLFPEFEGKLKFIETDITSHNLISTLESTAGYRPGQPAIIILEGISYYLEKSELENIIHSFNLNPLCYWIIEYMVPYNRVIESRRSIPEYIFGLIRQSCDCPAVTMYTSDELSDLFRSCGSETCASYSMADMELARIGKNTYFQHAGDGWIECITGRPRIHS